MNLKEYREQFDVTYSKIAELCGCGIPMISKIANNTISPSFNLAVRIEQATDGHVPRDNWYPPRLVSLIIEGVSV